jgi:hypothetical protein
MEVFDMPFGDGTGPAGMGPMTGRALGYCAGYPHPGYAYPGFGFRGRGFRGGGRGWRHWYYATGLPGWMRAGYTGYAPYTAYAPYPPESWSKDQEMEVLKNQAEGMRNALSEIEKRISDLESSAEKK